MLADSLANILANTLSRCFLFVEAQSMSLFRKCLLLFLCFCLSLTAMHTAVAAPAEPARPGIPDVAQLQRSLVPDSQNMVPSLVLQDRVTLIPYLEYYIDSSYAMDVTEAASEQLRDKYELFAPERKGIDLF